MAKFETAPKETERELTWYEAKLYCFSLKIDDKVDWRLPTLEELLFVYDNEHDFQESWYWTSDPITRGTIHHRDYPDACNDDFAVQIYMKYGEDDIDHKSEKLWVRPVRDYED